MISKIFTGHSFYGAVRYVCHDEHRAKVLATEGVREHHYKLMIKDFTLQQELRPAKKQACFHSILSFYPGEKISDERMVEIAKKYLVELGITNTQYAIAKHTDKAHVHLHIIANLVNNDGDAIKDNWIGLKGKKTAQRLTQEYQLVQVAGKNLALTHLEALSASEAARYNIYMRITEHLPHCRSMKDLELHLLKQGIATLYKHKGQTGEKQGVSFKMGRDCFKGSTVDRKYSLGNLEKIFAVQQQQANRRGQNNANITMQKTSSRQLLAQNTKQANNETQDIKSAPAQVMDLLLKPSQSFSYIPSKLMAEARRKRKRKLS